MKGVFDKFAYISCDATYDSSCVDASSKSDESIKYEAFIKPDQLQDALLELGVALTRGKVEELVLAMDLDEKGGLDFEEFKHAVQQPLTQLEQWASMLPLAGLLAKSLPVIGGEGDQPLRNFSRLGENEIDTVVEVFSEGLRRILIEARTASRQIFDNMNKKASEAANDLAGGDSAGSKFKTFKMSTGKVTDYYKGLSSRIGTFYELRL